ncbi:hypothetical protein G3N58_17920 [Paraburkholderia sp. Ac-20342]|uniref:hypothetical protein n=1 Tax=Paraburkholderia sp. Ac-20342 TaxID=2703889 RepID=UPI00197CD629|nr:hypothetical protein [Paraburkholderia sp. Ac-20342]MBN3848687.1 hypothetical protein [Paraburkholderia sp. Ac-20342]
MTLYAVHVQGPDDIIAAPSKREAEVLADKLNVYFAEMTQKSGPAAPTIEAVVIKYPFTAESHAEALADDWADHAKFIGPLDPEPERDTKTIDMFGEG